MTFIMYKIKWKEWNARHNSWEPAEHIDQEAIDELNKRTKASVLYQTVMDRPAKEIDRDHGGDLGRNV